MWELMEGKCPDCGRPGSLYSGAEERINVTQEVQAGGTTQCENSRPFQGTSRNCFLKTDLGSWNLSWS